MGSRSKIARYISEDKDHIRRHYFYNLDSQEKMDEAIDLVYQWVQKHEHFIKKDFSKDYIERCLITTKGSIERTKAEIDKLCTFKTLLPRFFDFTNMADDLNEILSKLYFAIAPRLSTQYYRILIMKFKKGANIENFDLSLLYRLIIATSEYLKQYDYATGFMLLADFTDTNTTDVLAKANLVELQQAFSIVTKGYGCRIKGLIFLTESKAIDGFFSLLKPLLSEKISSRLHVSRNVESLKEFMDMNILPTEYGGEQNSLEALNDAFVEEILSEEHIKYVQDMSGAGTDESRRQRNTFNDKYMGMPGTFRTLNLD